MSAFLQIYEAGSARDVAVLPNGKPLTIGRGEKNDVPVPTDGQMSSRHASLTLTGASCVLRDLDSTNGTWLNDQSVAAVELQGPAIFRCGTTYFQLDWPSHAPASQAAAASPEQQNSVGSTACAAPDRGSASKANSLVTKSWADAEIFDLRMTGGFCGASALEIMQRFSLADEIEQAPEVGEGVEEFVARLLAAEDDSAAIGFLAFALPRRCAIWWLIQCLLSDFEFEGHDRTVLDLSVAWVRRPNRQSRRQPLKLAERHEVEGLARWVADAVFHSHGSLAAANTPEVQPKVTLAGKTILAAVSLAVVDCEPDQIPIRRRRYIADALGCAKQDSPWT